MPDRLIIPPESFPALRGLIEVGASGVDRLNTALSGSIIRISDLSAVVSQVRGEGEQPLFAPDLVGNVTDTLVSFGFLGRDQKPPVVVEGMVAGKIARLERR